MSDMNLLSVNVDRFTRLVEEQLEDENLTPVLGLGRSGIGKTESIFELCQKLGIGFKELRLVTMTETDLLGVPVVKEYPDPENDGDTIPKTQWASNDMLPIASRDGEVGILVLDEITSATSTIRAAAYQLLDSKRSLGPYTLPPKWLVVALGNGAEDGGVYSGMEGAFLNRCLCLRVEPDVNVWKRWAVANDVNQSVTAFISFAPQNLHKFNPDDFVSVFPSPRSWTNVSKKLNARERRVGGLLDDMDVLIYAAAAVGETTANEFAAFYKYNNKTISAEDILSGSHDGSDVKELGSEVMHLVIQGLIRQMETELNLGKTGVTDFTDEVQTRTANAISWLYQVGQVKLDYAVMAIRELVENVTYFQTLVSGCEGFLENKCPDYKRLADLAGGAVR